MRFAHRIGLVLFVITAGVVAASPPAAANELGTEPGDTMTVANTDYASFGVGAMRGTGTGMITVSGISGTISKALLYWNGPTNSIDPSANASVTFNGSLITGTNIGFSSDNCWGFDNGQSYRADVTEHVAGDGDYALSGFRKTDIELGTIADVDGASLIIFFDDGSPASNQDVTLVDGNDSNVTNSFDTDGWDATIADIAHAGGTADLQLHVADGQSFVDGQVDLNDTQLLAEGPNFEGESVPGDFAPGQDPNGEGVTGNLWDIKTYDITEFMSSPSTTLHLTSLFSDDCVSLVAALVAVPSATSGVPGKPTINQAVAGNTKVGLNWSAPSSDGGSPITSYTAYASPCPTANPSPCPVLQNVSPTPNAAPFVEGNPTTFSYFVTGLQNNTTYAFTVTASNVNGEGPPSDPATATPNASADTNQIQANGTGSVDIGFAGGALTCSGDPSSVTCKNIVAKYTLSDPKDVGAVIGLAALPNAQYPGGAIACLKFDFASGAVTAGGECDIVADKAVLSTYPTSVQTLTVPHLAFEQDDTSVTTAEHGAPCLQLYTNTNGTPQLSTAGQPICKNPDFPHVFGTGSVKTNMCPEGTGWTPAHPCAYIYYKVERIEGYDLSPSDCGSSWPNCTWGTLANPRATRPVKCSSGPTCGKEVIIGSSVSAGVKLASGQYAVRPWCQGKFPNFTWLPCDFKVMWLNDKTNKGNKDMQWQDYEVADPGGHRTG